MTQKDEARRKYLQATTRAGREIYETKEQKFIESVEEKKR